MWLWCAILVSINHGGEQLTHYETVAKGVVRLETDETYVLDFSEYARQNNYIGDYKNVEVLKYKCIEE